MQPDLQKIFALSPGQMTEGKLSLRLQHKILQWCIWEAELPEHGLALVVAIWHIQVVRPHGAEHRADNPKAFLVRELKLLDMCERYPVQTAMVCGSDSSSYFRAVFWETHSGEAGNQIDGRLVSVNLHSRM